MDDTRLTPSNSVCRLHRSSFYGVPATGRPQALPKHASLRVRGSLQLCVPVVQGHQE